MLILSRKAGQAMVVGEDVEITVLEVRGDMVRLGIQAPRSVRVHRKEVYLQIAEANRQAGGTDLAAVTRAAGIRPPGAPAPAQPPGVVIKTDRNGA